jgi:hypothetical protein
MSTLTRRSRLRGNDGMVTILNQPACHANGAAYVTIHRHSRASGNSATGAVPSMLSSRSQRLFLASRCGMLRMDSRLRGNDEILSQPAFLSS